MKHSAIKTAVLERLERNSPQAAGEEPMKAQQGQKKNSQAQSKRLTEFLGTKRNPEKTEKSKVKKKGRAPRPWVQQELVL